MLPRQGGIAHEDSLGQTATIRTGQVLMMRAGHGIEHGQFNASNTGLDRHLQLWLEPALAGLAPRVELRDVQAPACGDWRLLAGPEGLAQQAEVRLGAACETRPLMLPLAQGQTAFLHVIEGACQARLPGASERLAAGEALAVEHAPGPIRLDAEAQRAEFLLVTFPESLLLRGRTSAVVRAGRVSLVLISFACARKSRLEVIRLEQ